MAWWDGPMIGLDLETTSAHPEHARIVSAALVRIGPSAEDRERRVERWSTVVNPGVEIPQEAIDVHGITNERARAEGVPLVDALMRISEVLYVARRKMVPVVIQNARYDLTVAHRELLRVGGGDWMLTLSGLAVVDPLVVEKHLDRYRPKRVASHSLEDCCRVWHVPLEGVTHDATFDAIAACRLAWRLMTSGRVLRRTRNQKERLEFIQLYQEWEYVKRDLRLLHAWQQRIASAEAERLQAYFRAGDERKGVPPMPNRVCPRDWPVVPVGTDWGDDTPSPGPGLADRDALMTPEWD